MGSYKPHLSAAVTLLPSTGDTGTESRGLSAWRHDEESGDKRLPFRTSEHHKLTSWSDAILSPGGAAVTGEARRL